MTACCCLCQLYEGVSAPCTQRARFCTKMRASGLPSETSKCYPLEASGVSCCDSLWFSWNVLGYSVCLLVCWRVFFFVLHHHYYPGGSWHNPYVGTVHAPRAHCASDSLYGVVLGLDFFHIAAGVSVAADPDRPTRPTRTSSITPAVLT